MYFNTFAAGSQPVDLTNTEDLANLLESAGELGLVSRPPVRLQARNLVANGHRFHLLEWGDEAAPSVIIVHGRNQTGHAWDFVSLSLCDEFRVIAIDQRGHGDSEWPRDGDMSPGAMAQDLADIIDTLALARPAIIAHSMGGIVALTLLCRRPLARRLVLVDIGLEQSRAGPPRNFMPQAQEWDSVDDYVERVSRIAAHRSREHILRTMRYNVMERVDGKLVSKHYQRVIPAGNGAAASPFWQRPGYDDVANIACPVLIARGSNSNVLSPEHGERLAEALPDARLVTIPDCGHNIHTENTAGLLTAVRPFLSEA